MEIHWVTLDLSAPKLTRLIHNDEIKKEYNVHYFDFQEDKEKQFSIIYFYSYPLLLLVFIKMLYIHFLFNRPYISLAPC